MPTHKPSIGGAHPGIEADYDFRDGDHELRITLDEGKLTDDELSEAVKAVSSGPIEFGMHPETREGLLLIARFGGWLSVPCFYHYRHQVQAAGDHVPPPDPRHVQPGSCDRLRVVLVDAETDEEEPPKELLLSPELTQRIRRAIAVQATGAYNADEYDRWVATMTGRTADDLWRQCIAFCCEG